MMFGSAESERPTLTKREIIFEEFQPIITYVITIHQRHRQTDGQTTCDRKTALCTKVHRAVKIAEMITSATHISGKMSLKTAICARLRTKVTKAQMFLEGCTPTLQPSLPRPVDRLSSLHSC